MVRLLEIFVILLAVWRPLRAALDGRFSTAFPPGSLGIFPNNWTNDRFYLNLASKHGPIFKTSNFLHPTVCMVGLERGLALLREHEGSLATPPLPFSKYVPGGLLRYMRHFGAPALSCDSSPRLQLSVSRSTVAGFRGHCEACVTHIQQGKCSGRGWDGTIFLY